VDIRVKIFQALSDETRLQIIIRLIECQEAPCSELIKESDLTRPALSHHFRTLREAGLIEVTRRGQFRFYSLNKGHIEKYLPGLLKAIK